MYRFDQSLLRVLALALAALLLSVLVLGVAFSVLPTVVDAVIPRSGERIAQMGRVLPTFDGQAQGRQFIAWVMTSSHVIPMVALWSALAVLVLLVAGHWKRRNAVAPAAGAIVLPWLLLDAQWQSQLQNEIHASQERFDRRSIREKHLRDGQGDWYRFLQSLKSDVLPGESQRLVLFYDPESDDPQRVERSPFYLLPHNVLLASQSARLDASKADYVIWLSPGLADSAAQAVFASRVTEQACETGDGCALHLLQSHPMANVYTVLPLASLNEPPSGAEGGEPVGEVGQ